MKLFKRRTLKAGIAKKEVPEAEFIPYDGHWSRDCILTKEKELLMVIRLAGFSFETADDDDVDMKKIVRNTLFKSVASGNYALWFHTVRRKQVASVEGEFEGAFCEYMDREWERKHENNESFVNDLYLTVIKKKSTETVGKIEDLVLGLLNKGDKDAWKRGLKADYKDLEEIVNRLLGSLKDYKPKILGLRETENGIFSELLEFFGILVNGGNYSPMLVPVTTDISRYIPTHRLYFGKRALEIRSASGQSKFSGAISIKEYAPSTSAGILDTFLQLPFELVISQSYIFTNRGSAINAIGMHQQRMASSGDKAISQMEELTLAMDMAMSGHIAFGLHHLSIFVAEDTLEKLESAMSLCYAELVNAGINPCREGMTLQATYWAQLPANFKYIARGATINTLNLSGFAALHNYPTGQRDNNHWGPAVTLLDTTSGTPYYFNFHVRDVGHSTIIGPTGAGKTVMMNFLMAQAQKFGIRMFFFDKDRGAEIFIRALGGSYSVIEPAADCGFNPLQLEDSYENRGFLAEWLRVLVISSHNTPLTPEENDRIAEAVEGNYRLPLKERKLANISPFLGLEGPGSLASRLKMWHSGETHAGLFDNDIDNLDLTVGNVFGFEMANVLADGLSLSPVLLYLFHKVNLALDGTPTVIVLDEAWALIDNEIFAPKIKDWLKVLRKLNAMVIFATQSVEDVSKSAISDTLVQQTATQIFLPNAKGTAEYQKTFMLSDREFALIKTTDPGTRYFLVKQGPEVVVARIDLSGMDNIINVLSGRAETVILLDQIMAEVGEDPEDWLDIFYKKVKEL